MRALRWSLGLAALSACLPRVDSAISSYIPSQASYRHAYQADYQGSDRGESVMRQALPDGIRVVSHLRTERQLPAREKSLACDRSEVSGAWDIAGGCNLYGEEAWLKSYRTERAVLAGEVADMHERDQVVAFELLRASYSWDEIDGSNRDVNALVLAFLRVELDKEMRAEYRGRVKAAGPCNYEGVWSRVPPKYHLSAQHDEVQAFARWARLRLDHRRAYFIADVYRRFRQHSSRLWRFRRDSITMALAGLATGVSVRANYASRAAQERLFKNLFPEHSIGEPIQKFTVTQVSRSTFSRKLNYVVTADGKLLMGRIKNNAIGGGHIDLASGAPVKAAGEVTIVRGKLHKINNRSGHYKPSGATATRAALKAFRDAGFDVAGKYVELTF